MNRITIALLVAVAAAPFLIWAISVEMDQQILEAGVRRCLGQMVVMGTHTEGAEARVRARIAEIQEKWGMSVRQAVEIECGRDT